MTGENNGRQGGFHYDGEPLDPELLGITRRLDHDGATWRRGLPDERHAAQKVIAVLSSEPPAPAAWAQQAPTPSSARSAPPPGGSPPANPPQQQGPQRVQRLLAVVAMLAVVILLAALLKAFAPRQAGPHPTPTATAATTPTATSFPGAWHIAGTVALQAAPDFAPSDPRVAYEVQVKGPGKPSPSMSSVTLRRSDDAGKSWHNLAPPPGLVVDNSLLDLSLVVSPFDAQVVFLYSARSTTNCTPQGDRGPRAQALSPRTLQGSGGVCLTQYRSADGGGSWANLTLPVPGIIRQVAYDGNGTVYALVAQPLYGSGVEPPERLIASTDVGLTWHVADASLWAQGYGVAGIAAAPSVANSDRLVSVWAITNPVALSQDPQASPRYQLWRSDDSGTTWRLTFGDTLPHQYSPFLIAGAGTLYQLEQQPAPSTDADLAAQLPAVSTDGGKTWIMPPTAGLRSTFSFAGTAPVVSGAAIIIPFVDGNNTVFYSWQPGAASWTEVAPPLQMQPLQELFAVQTRGSTTLWAVYDETGATGFTVASFTLT